MKPQKCENFVDINDAMNAYWLAAKKGKLRNI